MKVKPGTKLGPYKIQSPLGSGGMGVVYRARDERLERDVAIKVLPSGLITDETARRRFRKEALALARLSHPNIAALHDVGEQDGSDYLVMEYLAGQSLADKLKAGPLPIKEVIQYGAQIAAAIEEAHEHCVIHRDLKPANIIISPKGHAKVLDFGLAKILAEAGSETPTQSITETRGIAGTPQYMSPEQAEGKQFDSRTDLWSLGVVLYESLTGRPPFEGNGNLAILRAITETSPKPLRDLCPGLPDDMQHIVSRAMEKDLTKRYQSATEMTRDLAAAQARLSARDLHVKPGIPFRRATAAIVVLGLLLFVALATWFFHRSEKRHWVLEQAIPEINRLNAANQPLAAYLLLRKAEQYLPGDPVLAKISAQTTSTISVTSNPPGATVAMQDYLPNETPWHGLGQTPLAKIQVPKGYFRWRISKTGTNDYIAAPLTSDAMNFDLNAMQAAPEGMVPVNGQHWASFIGFIGWVGPYDLPSYYIDRFEVSNREYQQFVDSGGYRKREYWKEKFRKGNRELSWDEAISLFRDSTDRPGPSTWQGGHYPEGQADYPVSGISWYEASAYAAYAGKSLPVLSQWYIAAPPDVAANIVPASNMTGKGVAAVGAYEGVGPFGTYDMAGNVREWIANSSGGDTRMLLGGAWNSQAYIYGEAEAFAAFDRSAGNGFRCVRNNTPVPKQAADPIQPLVRDFTKYKPVSDAVFHAYSAMYAYEKTSLNEKAEGLVEDTADWRKEKVSYDTAYGGRMNAYLFLPKNVAPPYQTVLFFPSARVEFLDTDSSHLGDIEFFDYIVQSGRAVLYPVYQGTYERQHDLRLPGASQAMELTTQLYKDVARSLDYLETRSDIDKSKLAYLGVSLGTAEGVIFTTLAQDRLKTVVFLDGGYFLDPPRPGGDQADFAPRLKKPVLMVNGRYDYCFSLDRAQEPLFRTLGTPAADKKHVVLETPHDVTADRPNLVKAVLQWLDKYLGRVST